MDSEHRRGRRRRRMPAGHLLTFRTWLVVALRGEPSVTSYQQAHRQGCSAGKWIRACLVGRGTDRYALREGQPRLGEMEFDPAADLVWVVAVRTCAWEHELGRAYNPPRPEVLTAIREEVDEALRALGETPPGPLDFE